eukprot:3516041-Prymnesium_polylepis.1
MAMASRESSRSLGSRAQRSRLGEPTLAAVAKECVETSSQVVHNDADSLPLSAFESPGFEAGNKRQRVLEDSTGQDGAAPVGDDAA